MSAIALYKALLEAGVSEEAAEKAVEGLVFHPPKRADDDEED